MAWASSLTGWSGGCMCMSAELPELFHFKVTKYLDKIFYGSSSAAKSAGDFLSNEVRYWKLKDVFHIFGADLDAI